MNTNGMLNDLPKLQSKVNSDIESYVDKAVKDAKKLRIRRANDISFCYRVAR